MVAPVRPSHVHGGTALATLHLRWRWDVELSQRAARGMALATLAVACVVVGPAPQLTRALERTYAVILLEREQEAARRRRLRSGGLRGSTAPRPARPADRRP
jgi:hypothetical protein